MFIKEKLGPMWEYIQRVPDENRVKYCFDILSADPKYLQDEKKTQNLIREALRQLEKFFSKPRIEYSDTPIEKGEVAVLEEEIIEDPDA